MDYFDEFDFYALEDYDYDDYGYIEPSSPENLAAMKDFERDCFLAGEEVVIDLWDGEEW